MEENDTCVKTEDKYSDAETDSVLDVVLVHEDYSQGLLREKNSEEIHVDGSLSKEKIDGWLHIKRWLADIDTDADDSRCISSSKALNNKVIQKTGANGDFLLVFNKDDELSVTNQVVTKEGLVHAKSSATIWEDLKNQLGETHQTKTKKNLPRSDYFLLMKISYLCRKRMSQLSLHSTTAQDGFLGKKPLVSVIKENNIKISEKVEMLELERESILNHLGAMMNQNQLLSKDVLHRLHQDLVKIFSADQGSEMLQAQNGMKQIHSKVQRALGVLSRHGIESKCGVRRLLIVICQTLDDYISWKQSDFLPLMLECLREYTYGLNFTLKKSKDSAPLALLRHRVKRRQKELSILRLLEPIKQYCEWQRAEDGNKSSVLAGCRKFDLAAAVHSLRDLSCSPDVSNVLYSMGGLKAFVELLQITTKFIGPNTSLNFNIRNSVCKVIANLIYGDAQKASLLCSMKEALEVLVKQLRSQDEYLIKGAADALANVSLKASLESQKRLQEVGAVKQLIITAKGMKRLKTLESLLIALCNLSYLSLHIKADFCMVDSAFQFLAGLLMSEKFSTLLALKILHNVSGQIATKEELRRKFRKTGCYKLLMFHLGSSSDQIVFYVCETLWNLLLWSKEDQNIMRKLGAVGMLKSLSYSRDLQVAEKSRALLKLLVPSGCNKTTIVIQQGMINCRQETVVENMDLGLAGNPWNDVRPLTSYLVNRQ